MPEALKRRYTIDLTETTGARPLLEFEVELAKVERAHADDLASLMLDAYRGTIDDEGESIDDAREEVSRFFEDSPLLDSSYLATVEGRSAGATLIGTWRDRPLVAYVMTRPAYKQQGLATYLLNKSLQALKGAGWDEVNAFITEGNTASEALFRGMGAGRSPDD